MGDRLCHLEKFLDHLGERSHRSDREAEQLVLGKRLNYASGKPPMALPIIEQRLGTQYGFGLCHKASLVAIPANVFSEFMSPALGLSPRFQ
jgi:hypothetical protein